MIWQNEQRLALRPVSSLAPYANNPRTHTKKQIRQIAESIREFGWTNPVLIDGNDNVIAGHGRIEALNFLELPRFRSCARASERGSEARLYNSG